jgi:hypothetical protein
MKESLPYGPCGFTQLMNSSLAFESIIFNYSEDKQAQAICPALRMRSVHSKSPKV